MYVFRALELVCEGIKNKVVHLALQYRIPDVLASRGPLNKASTYLPIYLVIDCFDPSRY